MHGSLNVCHFRRKMRDAFEDAHAAVGAARENFESSAALVEPLCAIDVEADYTAQRLDN